MRLPRKQQKLASNCSTQSRLPEIKSKSVHSFEDSKLVSDRHGYSKRLIATNFLTLPDKEHHPKYYRDVGLPVALDTIEV